MSQAANNKPFDLLLFGATGFTGRLTVEYLFKNYGSKNELQWAMAGRNTDKLQEVSRVISDNAIPYFMADAQDAESLDTICQKTKVLCSTVGPYTKYGSEVIAACVRNGTHYCDLSGEVPWMRKMIDRYHEEAKNQKVKIVHSCGFDSIPSDMGVYFLQKEAKKLKGKYCHQVSTGVKAAKGGLSGGTYASFMEVLKEASNNKETYKILSDPYALNPSDDKPENGDQDFQSVEYDESFDSWKCPFMMATINTRIVRRSLALGDHPYGKDFRYNEFTLTGKGMKGQLKAYAQSIPMALMMSAKPGSWLSHLVDQFTPDPGEGPSREKRESGFWIFDLIGLWEDDSCIKVRLKGDRDPGYGSTSKMLAESAVCLAKDELPESCGSLTPSVAMGDRLLKRLQENAGLSFEVK